MQGFFCPRSAFHPNTMLKCINLYKIYSHLTYNAHCSEESTLQTLVFWQFRIHSCDQVHRQNSPPSMYFLCLCVCVCVSRSHCCSHSSLCFVTVATHSQARQSRSIAADARGKGVFALTRAACVWAGVHGSESTRARSRIHTWWRWGVPFLSGGMGGWGKGMLSVSTLSTQAT